MGNFFCYDVGTPTGRNIMQDMTEAVAVAIVDRSLACNRGPVAVCHDTRTGEAVAMIGREGPNSLTYVQPFFDGNFIASFNLN
jgi:hypothetical protein